MILSNSSGRIVSAVMLDRDVDLSEKILGQVRVPKRI